MKVAIVVVSRNAARYCFRLLRSLPKTTGVDYEVVWVDNRSRLPTRALLVAASMARRINRLILMDRNTLFAEANNVGVAAAARDCTHVLLLNSDTEVQDPGWLRRLAAMHDPGATAYGAVQGQPVTRADGYCLLVDRGLYRDVGGLDESHQWWWSVTRMQAALLTAGHRVRAVEHHDDQLVHFGGKSGGGWQTASGMDITDHEVRAWFGEHAVEIVATTPG